MQLKLSPDELAFRDEIRTFIADHYPAEMRVPNPETDLSKEQSLLWHRILYRKGWLAPAWPKEYGGPGWSITQRFLWEQETTRAGTLPAAGVQRDHGRPGHLHLRQRGAEGPIPAAHPVRRRLVVPGLFRTRIGLGPGLGADQGGPSGGPLCRQWPQDVDDLGPACRLDLLPGAHRPQRQGTGRHLLPADRHEVAGHHRPPDHHDRRCARGQRHLLRGCARARREPDRRGEQGLDLCQVPAGERTHQHGRRRSLVAHAGEAQADRGHRTPAGRPEPIGVHPRHRAGRAGPAGAGGHRAAHRGADGRAGSIRGRWPRSSRSGAPRSSSASRT